MKQLHKLTALAAVVAASFCPAALADVAETKGGIKIKTEDGRFEANVNGRIHFDAYVFDDDAQPSTVSNRFGSMTGFNERGGFAFRRTYLTLTGKAYGWKYKFEHDFSAEGGSATCSAVDLPVQGVDADQDGEIDAGSVNPAPFTPSCTIANTGASGFREMWVSTNLGPGELVLGQFKPYRGMEELTSSNEITMIERPVTTATGIYAGRQFLMGLGYKGTAINKMFYGVHAMSLNAANNTNEGLSYGGRVTFAPLVAEGSVIHLGLSASVDDFDTGAANVTSAFPYAGRRGPSQAFGIAGAASGPSLDNSQTTIALEAATQFGPFILQAEAAQASLDNTHLVGGAQQDSDVLAWYAQAGWFVTGERAPYKLDRGAFGKPKPNAGWGAIEVTARYDVIENKDQSATANPCNLGGGATGCEASTITAGVNWYVNPNVRLMLNYYMGEADRGLTAANSVASDEPSAITLRTQFAF